MGRDSAIEWCHHTFNPWWGCVRVSPGCEHCYAETLAHRYNQNVWGPAKTTGRRTFGDKHWREPERWNARASDAGVRERVFCASMADVFEDHPELTPQRERLWALIAATPALDWLLLTKRPENVTAMVPRGWDEGDDGFPWNVWIGASVEDQSRADERIPHLIDVPARVRFLSCEPLLGPIDLGHERCDREIDWVIVGGESGPGAREMNVTWARDLVEQARMIRAAPFVKQLGARAITYGSLACHGGDWPDGSRLHVGPTMSDPRWAQFRDAKGGDWSEWPADLRVREFPGAA